MQEGNKLTPLADSIKVNLLNRLYFEYSDNYLDSALSYAKQSLSLAEAIGFKRGIANGYNSMGQLNNQHKNFSEALAYHRQALKIRQAIGDKAGTAETYSNTAVVYQSQAYYPEALNYHLLALKIRREIGDKKGIGISLLDMGDIEVSQNNLPEALKNFKESLQFFEEGGYKKGIGAAYMNIGIVYQKQANYDEALKNYLKASVVLKETGDTQGMAEFNLNVAQVYTGQGNYNEAIKNVGKALLFYGNVMNRNAMGQSYMTLGIIYEKRGELEDALKYVNKALRLAQQVHAKDDILNCYNIISEIDARLKNYKGAYENHVLYKQYWDTSFNEDNKTKLAGLKLQYNFARQQDSIKAEQAKKDAAAKQQLQKQKLYTYGMLVGLILVMLVLFFGYRNFVNQRRATALMAVARERAERSEKFKEQFLANMSHEIRTPMNAVLGMTNLLLDTPLNKKQSQYLSAVKKSSENLLVILNDILDLSKLEAGKMQMEKEPFILRAQIEQVMAITRFKADEKGLLLTYDIANTTPEVVKGDAPRLNQILINLISNAVKFTAKGFVKLTVTGDASGLVKFCVTDSGIGITTEQQKKIFESFTQAEVSTNRKYGGTGLGLAICKTLIELQGGTIDVKSLPGEGSEFSFSIAYEPGSITDIADGKQMDAADYAVLKKLRILVAEDYEFNQIVIKDTLEHLLPGIAVDIAGNGKIAVEKLATGYYDIVLMDVQMPEMDGYEATRFIRNNLKSQVPVIALTASVIRSDLDKCTDAGMNGYIPKPFEREELLRELMKHRVVNPLVTNADA